MSSRKVSCPDNIKLLSMQLLRRDCAPTQLLTFKGQSLLISPICKYALACPLPILVPSPPLPRRCHRKPTALYCNWLFSTQLWFDLQPNLKWWTEMGGWCKILSPFHAKHIISVHSLQTRPFDWDSPLHDCSYLPQSIHIPLPCLTGPKVCPPLLLPSFILRWARYC